MITIHPGARGDPITIKLSGVITGNDLEASLVQIEPILDQQRAIHLLLDWEDLEGWAKGARSVGTWFWMVHCGAVRRVAIVADEKWADETVRITDLFKMATVRQFQPAKRQRALDWTHKE